MICERLFAVVEEAEELLERQYGFRFLAGLELTNLRSNIHPYLALLHIFTFPLFLVSFTSNYDKAPRTTLPHSLVLGLFKMNIHYIQQYGLYDFLCLGLTVFGYLPSGDKLLTLIRSVDF